MFSNDDKVVFLNVFVDMFKYGTQNYLLICRILTMKKYLSWLFECRIYCSNIFFNSQQGSRNRGSKSWIFGSFFDSKHEKGNWLRLKFLWRDRQNIETARGILGRKRHARRILPSGTEDFSQSWIKEFFIFVIWKLCL